MPTPDPAAALECLARGKTWEEAMQLYLKAVPGAGRVGAELAFQQAAEVGWLLSAIPELRLLVEAWQAVARIQDDAQRAREEAEKHRLPDGSHTAMDRGMMGGAFAKCNDSAISGEKVGLAALSTVQRCLTAWRRASVAFAREYQPQGRECPGYEEWRRACRKLVRIEVADGNLAMALSLVGRIRDPDALQVEHLDPLVQARDYALALTAARRCAADTGDTAALVQIGPALTAAQDRYQRLLDPGAADGSDDIRAAAQAVAADLDQGRA